MCRKASTPAAVEAHAARLRGQHPQTILRHGQLPQWCLWYAALTPFRPVALPNLLAGYLADRGGVTVIDSPLMGRFSIGRCALADSGGRLAAPRERLYGFVLGVFV